MPYFRKKPVIIEAQQWTGDNFEALTEWVRDEAKSFYTGATQGELLITTLEGTMTASPQDWIIKGVHGEFYPCKPDIFEATYEFVENPNGE